MLLSIETVFVCILTTVYKYQALQADNQLDDHGDLGPFFLAWVDFNPNMYK